jgi:hypothetical protein
MEMRNLLASPDGSQSPQGEKAIKIDQIVEQNRTIQPGETLCQANLYNAAILPGAVPCTS